MVLPTGVNKATGLRGVLKEMHLDPENVVAVGDAENDHAFLSMCGIGVAVSNALPMLKERADLVTQGARGAGVTELIDRILATDLADIPARPSTSAPAPRWLCDDQCVLFLPGLNEGFLPKAHSAAKSITIRSAPSAGWKALQFFNVPATNHHMVGHEGLF